jgi:hypothetical protein
MRHKPVDVVNPLMQKCKIVFIDSSYNTKVNASSNTWANYRILLPTITLLYYLSRKKLRNLFVIPISVYVCCAASVYC